MLKLLSSASILALVAVAPAAAQTNPPSTTPPATTQDKSPSTTQNQSPTTTPPAATQDKSPSTTAPSMTQDKSAQPTQQGGTQPAAETTAVTLTADQAKEWVDKPVFSNEGKEIGEVYEFKRSTDNKVTELHADLGGFLGMGETRVKLAPSEFKLQGDRVVLNLSEEQAKALPKVEK
jgi:PRC-barrel domain